MLVYIYLLLTLAMGITLLSHGAIYPGVAGISGPTLCWVAACGLKGGFTTEALPRKLTEWGAAITCVAVGIGMVVHSGYKLEVFGVEVTGVTWCLAGLVAGWLSRPREVAAEERRRRIASSTRPPHASIPESSPFGSGSYNTDDHHVNG